MATGDGLGLGCGRGVLFLGCPPALTMRAAVTATREAPGWYVAVITKLETSQSKWSGRRVQGLSSQYGSLLRKPTGCRMQRRPVA
jgi:hypothetical protein